MVGLLARPEGTASHLTAARALGLIDSAPLRPTLSVPTSRSARSPVATIVRSAVGEGEAVVVDGLRVTHATRTLIDLAATVPKPLLHRMVDDALGRRLTSPGAMDRSIASTARRSRGAAEALMAAVEVWRPAIRPGSVAEVRLLRQLREWGLPAPGRQLPVTDRQGVVVARLDVGWPSVRLGLEYDSLAWHGPARWASDEARHAMVTGLGWTVLHVDAGDLRPGSSLRRRLEAWPGLLVTDRQRDPAYGGQLGGPQ